MKRNRWWLMTSCSQSIYQNGDLSTSLTGFRHLITIDKSHDLADNCQYWIGEIYYSEKKYDRCIVEFSNVFNYSGTNKADDSRYKLALCYLNIGNKIEAVNSFNQLIQDYPRSS